MTLHAHIIDALRAAPQLRYPYPHFFAQNVFPADFYAKTVEMLATKDDFVAKEMYANRTFATKVDLPDLDFMLERDFLLGVLNLFARDWKARFPDNPADFELEMRLIRDHAGYKIGPHTDGPSKVLSLLFYLPATTAHFHCGTGIYMPNAPGFRCEGGPHYHKEQFFELSRAPYLPNTCFGFWKTDNSFHGVAPIPVEFNRDVLLFNVYHHRNSAEEE